MTTHFSASLHAGLDTAIAGSSLSGLASAAYALGVAINNTPTDGTTISYDTGDLTITLSSAVTAGAIASVTVWVLPAVDGTNYPTPPGATAGAAPVSLSYTFQLVPSVSTQTIVCPNIPLPPYNFKIMIQNNTGVAWPATTTSTCQLQRRCIANW
jgi:hypothetical protein